MNLFNKKGQITIFIILGIVLLVGVGLFFYLRAEAPPSGPGGNDVVDGRSDDVSLTTVPQDFKPIRQFVESCVLEIAEEGIKKMALHGGYIDPENESYSIYDFKYDPLNPTESEMVSFGLSENSPKMPYWYYLTGENTCEYCPLDSYAPSLDFMAAQLAVYVENNLDRCLDGFSDFKVTGFEIQNKSKPNVSVEIFDSGQDFLVDYTLEATKGGVTQEITDYYTKSDMPLKQLYDVASNITQYELITNSYAAYTNKLINVNSGGSMDLLPPIYYYDDSRIPMIWMKPVVQDKIQSLIRSYSQVWQILGSKNFDDSFIQKISDEDSMEKMLYLQGIMPVFSKDDPVANNIDMNVAYLDQPMYVEVWPHNGMKIEPKSFELDADNKFLPVEYENHYRFYYDVSYPLIYTLKNFDENNANNNLEFNFPIEINIRKNTLINDYLAGYGPLPWSNDIINFELANLDTSQAMAEEESEIIYGEQASQNIFCKDTQLRSGNVSVMVYDAYNLEPVVNAYVSYGCGTYAECDLGKTDLKHGTGYFSGKAPICLNGYLQIEKQGYQTKRIKLTTEEGVPSNLGRVKMYPIISKNVTAEKLALNYNIVEIHDKKKIRGVIADKNTKKLSNNESVIVMMNRVTEGIDPNFEVYVRLTGNETKQIDLIPGKYTIDITYMDDLGVVVPKKCDKTCVKRNIFKTCTDYMKYPPEDIELKPAPWGGIKFNEENPISLRKNEVYDTNTSLKVYTVVYPHPNEIACLDSLEEMSKTEEYTLRYRSKLVPRFVK